MAVCVKTEVTLRLKPTFPANDACEEVEAAALETLFLQFCVDEMHVPARLIIREIRVKDLDGGSCGGVKNRTVDLVPVTATDGELISDIAEVKDSKEAGPLAISLSPHSPLPNWSAPSEVGSMGKADTPHRLSQKTSRPQSESCTASESRTSSDSRTSSESRTASDSRTASRTAPASKSPTASESRSRSKKHARSRRKASKTASRASPPQKASAARTGKRSTVTRTCSQSSCTLSSVSSHPLSFATSTSGHSAEGDGTVRNTDVKRASCSRFVQGQTADCGETTWSPEADSDAADSRLASAHHCGRRCQALSMNLLTSSDITLSLAHAAVSSASLQADPLTSSDVSLQPADAAVSSASLQVDRMRFTPELLPACADKSQNARKSASSSPRPPRTQPHSDLAQVNKRDNNSSPHETGEPPDVGDPRVSLARQGSSVRDTPRGKSSGQQRNQREPRRERRDLRIVRVSQEALVPEISERRVQVRGHYVSRDTGETLPFTVFVYKDDDVGQRQGQVTLSGSYVRKMLTGSQHLRWRFRQVVGEEI